MTRPRKLESRFLTRSKKLQRGDELPPGVMKMVKVFVAVKRRSSPATRWRDGMATRASFPRSWRRRICPFLADGQPVDIVLNPLGVPPA
jgi:DNA-directed RNA polymerase subunit beta